MYVPPKDKKRKNMGAQNTHAPFFLIIVSIRGNKSPIKHALFFVLS